MADDKPEIVFFDLETSTPAKPGQGFAILEFGAILVCPKKLIELRNFSTLVCPPNLDVLSTKNERRNGITRDAVSTAPSFSDIADMVFDLLDGRIWAGHNILRFDCARIREAFAEIGRSPPEAKGIIDSLALLTERFGRRAGNMKMATLASYFGLGKQTHRSLDDVRMNLEVLKYCATVLLLESSLPDILTNTCWVSPRTTRRTRSGGKVLPLVTSNSPNSSSNSENLTTQTPGEQRSNLVDPAEYETEAFDMKRLGEELTNDSIQANYLLEEHPESNLPDVLTNTSGVSPRTTRRTRSGKKVLPLETSNVPKSNSNSKSLTTQTHGDQTLNTVDPSEPEAKVFDMRRFAKVLTSDSIQPNDHSEEHESSLPDILTNTCWVSPRTTRRTRSGGKVLPLEMSNSPNSSSNSKNLISETPGDQTLNSVHPTGPESEAFDMRKLVELISDSVQDDDISEKHPVSESSEPSHPPVTSESCSSSPSFFSPDDVSISSINVSIFPFYRGGQRIRIMHNDVILKLICTNLKVRFGISTKYVDQAGHPRLSIVVGAPPSLCQVLDACDNHAYKIFVQSGSLSEWRPVVSRKNGYWNFPTVRLQIPTVLTGNVASYGTEIFQKEAGSGAEQKLKFRNFDVAELERLLTPKTSIDAFFSLDPYDFCQNAGIRLVAEKLVIHPK